MTTFRNTIILAVLLISSASIAQSLLINEVVYANKTVIVDSDSASSDYIELYNNGTESIDLEGYQLTDDTTETTYWSFPAYILKPGEFKLVFASGKNKQSTAEFHTDFRLSVMTDPVFLLNSSGEIIDQIMAQCVPTDKAIGRLPDGSDNIVIFNPTPELSNNASNEIVIHYTPDTLMVNHQSGFYEKTIALEFQHHNSGNTIYYTLDGDEPGINELMYNQSIKLNNLTPEQNRFANIPDTYKEPGDKLFKGNIVRAQVFSEGCPASNVISNVYFIDEQNQINYNVPIVSIITEKDNLFDDEIGIYTDGNHNNYNQRGKAWEREAHIEIFDEQKNIIIDQNAGVRISGQGSRSAPQKSLRFYARDSYGKEKFNYPFFSQKPENNSYKTLLMRSSRGLSGTLLKDELSQNLVRNMNIDYSGTQTVIAFINGEYWGIYSLRERLDEGYVENNFSIENPEIDIIRHAVSTLSLEKGSWNNYSDLNTFLSTNDPNSDNFYSEINKRIDIPELIDFYVAQMYFANYDFPHNNLKMWRPNNMEAKWRYYFFDCDACMINVKQDQLSEYTNDSDQLQIHESWSTDIMRIMLMNEQFRSEFSRAYYYHLSNTFHPQTVLNEIEYFEKLYQPLVAEHTYRWYQPEDYTKWKNNVDMLKVFAMQRPGLQAKQLSNYFGGPFRIYPNPGNGSFYIETKTSSDESVAIQIMSMSGKVEYAETAYPKDNAIHIQSLLPSGIYLVRINSRELIQTQKLIIQ